MIVSGIDFLRSALPRLARRITVTDIERTLRATPSAAAPRHRADVRRCAVGVLCAV